MNRLRLKNADVSEGLVRLDAKLKAKADNATARSFDFISSTDTIDSYGEIVKQDWDLSRYEKNPVVLLEHSFGKSYFGDAITTPIARAPKTRLEMIDGKSALVTTIDFPPEGEVAASDEICKLVQLDILNGLSVGFDPSSVTYEKRDGVEIAVLSGNKLYEQSLTALPANEDCVRRRSATLARRNKSALAAKAAAPIAATPAEAVPAEAPMVPAHAAPEMAPSIPVTTLAALVGCYADDATVMKSIGDARAEVATLRVRAAFAVSMLAQLGLDPAATEADAAKSIATLRSRAANADELEPKVAALTKANKAATDAIVAREVEWIIARGKDYQLSYGEAARKALTVFRTTDPVAFAENHKAALDGLAKFDSHETFAPITGAGGAGEQPVALSAATIAAADDPEAIYQARVDEVIAQHKAAGKTITARQAMDIIAKGATSIP